MEQQVNQTNATRVLHESLRRAKNDPSVACSIKACIDFILLGKNCLTYRYILLTALTAKATNESVDILSLQAGDDSDGAYDARSLCSKVIYPFQRDFLADVLDGSNEDPLVNNPGRHPRLSKSNKSANGDPRRALDLLCDNLPYVSNKEEAVACLDYFISECLTLAEMKAERAESFSRAIVTKDVHSTRSFMDDLLDKNFGGVALLLVATSIFSTIYPIQSGKKIIPHPVNQSGASSSQMSDLDILNEDDTPFLAIELKDKPFTSTEVKKAAKTAFECNAPSMLFIAGRASSITDETYRYFDEVKNEYRDKGMIIGLMTIDALLDFFFATHYEFDAPFIFDTLDSTMMNVHASPEAINWVYRNAAELD